MTPKKFELKFAWREKWLLAWASPVCAGRGVAPHPFDGDAVTCGFVVGAGGGVFLVCVLVLVFLGMAGL